MRKVAATRRWLWILVAVVFTLFNGCATDSGEGAKAIFGSIFDGLFPEKDQFDFAREEGFGWNNEGNAKPTGRSDVRGL
jgi:hypothetical protein